MPVRRRLAEQVRLHQRQRRAIIVARRPTLQLWRQRLAQSSVAGGRRVIAWLGCRPAALAQHCDELCGGPILMGRHEFEQQIDDMSLCACREANIIQAVANDLRQDGQVFVAPEALWQRM